MAHYVEATGDHGILDEVIPFLDGAPLAPGEMEAYRQPAASAETASLLEHCIRAIERSLTAGTHGLPLIGSGDWNDGMNRVGHLGRGESVWLGWFLHTVLKAIAPLCEQAGDADRAARFEGEARGLPPCSSWPGTATGTGAATTTTARRSDRPRTTSAGSTRSRRPGRCSPAPRRPPAPSARWTRCARTWCGGPRAWSCC